jgi:hypothetical protein
MLRFVAAVMLLAPALAFAEDPINGSTPFVSVGLVLSGGSRGFAIGVELSGGAISDQSGGYLGAAAGLDYAPTSGDLPVRAYLEAEGGWVAFGLGVGPAFFFNDEPVALQITPYAALSSGIAACDRYEPFDVEGALLPLYGTRWRTRSARRWRIREGHVASERHAQPRRVQPLSVGTVDVG